jgi:hypothetical protein
MTGGKPGGGPWLDHLITCPECHRACDHRNTMARRTWALLCEEGRAMRPDLEDTERPAKA